MRFSRSIPNLTAFSPEQVEAFDASAETLTALGAIVCPESIATGYRPPADDQFGIKWIQTTEHNTNLLYKLFVRFGPPERWDGALEHHESPYHTLPVSLRGVVKICNTSTSMESNLQLQYAFFAVTKPDTELTGKAVILSAPEVSRPLKENDPLLPLYNRLTSPAVTGSDETSTQLHEALVPFSANENEHEYTRYPYPQRIYPAPMVQTTGQARELTSMLQAAAALDPTVLR